MYNMIEVVGVSPVSFAKATQEAVNTVKESHQVYWFEVVELRGGLRGDDIEFQVKLKIAIKE
ncbi:MAG: dodecin domain-containing protein [Anaerolineales bacterium]|nr:dodecin domain-containing protein [Anaerolineales bacterium]